MSITEKQTILVVDDAKAITQFIQQMLKEREYKAIGCGNGADAVRLAVEFNIRSTKYLRQSQTPQILMCRQ